MLPSCEKLIRNRHDELGGLEPSGLGRLVPTPPALDKSIIRTLSRRSREACPRESGVRESTTPNAPLLRVKANYA